MARPLDAYSGEDPYVFVCYAHEDTEVVYPEIRRLQDAGVNVWYDQGISPGQQWSEEIAQAIEHCSTLVVFISPASISSRNCRDEVQFAHKLGLDMLPIYLVPTELPGGLGLLLNSTQAIVKHEIPETLYLQRLGEALNVSLIPATAPPPQESAEAPSDPPELRPTGWRGTLSRLNRYCVSGNGMQDYLMLALIGAAPYLIAWLIGAWESRPVPIDAQFLHTCPLEADQFATTGFGERWNWLMYPVALPLWLFWYRYVFGRAFGISEQSPLKVHAKYRPILEHQRGVLSDWRGVAIALVFTLLLTAIDQYDVFLRLWYQPFECPAGRMDWGWYGILFPDVSTLGIWLLTIWTTAEQMLGVLLMSNAAVHIYRFNSAYMRSIYIRGRKGRYDSRYVLDFDDPDRRFGLRALSGIFDLQLLGCMIGGSLLLVSRYTNSDLDAADGLVRAIYCRVVPVGGECEVVVAPSATVFVGLFPDLVQACVVFSFAAFAGLILWIANVKLLPLRQIGESGGRSAYLIQLVRPRTKYDRLLQTGMDENVEQVAARFRQHHFWPTGDDRAADSLAYCVLVFLLMLLPVIPLSVHGVCMLLAFVVLSIAISRSYLWIQRHLLVRVDKSLVRASET